MADERYTFEQARVRLEEIAAQVRKKDTTLEKSLDLLEEGARLALMCTELVDHTDFGDTARVADPTGEGEALPDDDPAQPEPSAAPSVDESDSAEAAQ